MSRPDIFFLKKNQYYQLCPSAGKRAYIVLPTYYHLVEFVLHSKAKEKKINKRDVVYVPVWLIGADQATRERALDPFTTF